MEKKIKRKPFSGYTATLKEEFKGYSIKKFIQDLISGISIGACLLPMILALGTQSVNTSAITFGIMGALIACVVSNLIVTLIGGGTYQISTPCYALSVIISGATYSAFGLQTMLLACVISGLLLFICGVLRIGKFVKYVPRPIVCGFTLGITLTILVISLGNIFGINLTGITNVQRLNSFFTSGIKQINWISFAFFAVTLTISLIYPKKLEKILPSALILTAISALLVFLIKIDTQTVGKIEFDILNTEKFNIDGITFEMLKLALFPALSIFAITLTQSLVAGERVADKTDKNFNGSYQLAAQGLANLISPFLGGIPSSTSFESVAVSEKTGAQTRIANLFVVATLIGCIFLLPNAIAYIPYATTSAILIASLIKMNDYKSIKHYFKRRSYGALLLTLISTVSVFFLSISFSLLISMVLALFIMLYNMRTVEIYAELKKDLKTVGVNVTGPLYFASVDDFIYKIKAINCEYERLIIDLSGVTYIDSTALQKSLDYLGKLNETKVITFCGTRTKVLKAIAIDGFYQTFGAESFFNTFSDAYREKFAVRKKIEPIIEEPIIEKEKEVAVTEKEYGEQTVKADTEEITKVIPPQN